MMDIKDKIDELNQIGDVLMEKLTILIGSLITFKERKNSYSESFSEQDSNLFERGEKGVSKLITEIIDYDEQLENLKRLKTGHKILSSEERDKKRKIDSKKLFNQVLREVQRKRKEREKDIDNSGVEIITKEEIDLLLNAIFKQDNKKDSKKIHKKNNR